MYYQFNASGECVSSSTGAIEPIQGIVSVWCDVVYNDIWNLRLIDGKVVCIDDKDNVSDARDTEQ